MKEWRNIPRGMTKRRPLLKVIPSRSPRRAFWSIYRKDGLNVAAGNVRLEMLPFIVGLALAWKCNGDLHEE